MEIGDLVKYGPQMTGLQNCFGMIVGFNGTAVEVQWMDRYMQESLRVRTRGKEVSTELPDFLEVVSETR
tara:strand:- start:217 stop:423 length:207 start_codon:yes stop_codon:yes gene_type:complete